MVVNQNMNRFIEHTLLRPDASEHDIMRLIEEAIEYNFLGICVPPFWVKKVAREIASHNIQLVTVVGFPFGYNLTETKLGECKIAIDHGANEIDVVINLSAFKSSMPWVKVELAKCANFVHQNNCLIKAIIETSYLSDEEIANACKICAEAGIDFVKTSTGYAKDGAVARQVRLIRSLLPSNIGVKASGGIKSLKSARQMIACGADRLGTSQSIAIMKELSKELQHE